MSNPWIRNLGQGVRIKGHNTLNPIISYLTDHGEYLEGGRVDGEDDDPSPETNIYIKQCIDCSKSKKKSF